MHAANVAQTIACLPPVLSAFASLAMLLAGWSSAAADDVDSKQAQPAPRLVSKEVFLRHDNRRPHVTGFVAYADKSKTLLMHCSGREDYSDGYDNFAIRISSDNGRKWLEPEVRWKSSVVPAGRVRYAEPAAFFDVEHEKLIVLIDKCLYRETGELVIFLTRYAERSAKEWMLADYYRYRVAMP